MSFLKKSILVSFGQSITLVIGVVSSSILSRLLGPEKMGNLELVRSTQTILTAFFALGIGQASIYFFNNKKIPIEVLLPNTFLVFIACAFLFLITNIILHKLTGSYFGNLSIIELTQLFSFGLLLLFNTFYVPLFTAKLEAVNIVFSNILPKLVTLGVLFILLNLKISTIESALTALLAGYFVSTIFVIKRLKFKLQFKHKMHYDLIRNLISYGGKLSIANILYLLSNNVILFLIRIFNLDSFQDIGLFTRAVVLSNLVIIVPNTIAPLFYSRWASFGKKEREKELIPVLQLSVILSGLASIFVFLFSKYIVLLLFGSQYIEATIYVRLIAPVFVFSTITQVVLNFFNSSGAPEKPFLIMFTNLILNILIGYVSLSVWGVLGAAYTLMITNFLITLMSLKIAKSIIQLRVSSIFDLSVLFNYIKHARYVKKN